MDRKLATLLKNTLMYIKELKGKYLVKMGKILKEMKLKFLLAKN